MSLWNSIAGTIEVEIKSAAPTQTLSLANEKNIILSDIQYIDALTVRFKVLRGDYRALKTITDKRGEQITIISRLGRYWVVKRLTKRPVLLVGMFLFAVLLLYLPTRVLFVSVTGNENIPTQLILEKAASCGIRFGASRRDVRSEKMKNSLLSSVPELQWAGINTYGCVAVISVDERSDIQQKNEESGISSIVAACDGVIKELTVLSGNPLCKVGQAVVKDQVLVSGYTDCGISIKATRADAEIKAETRHNLRMLTTSKSEHRSDILSSESRYSLLVGKKLINFYKDSGISDATCVKMYTESFLTLPGGFQLPLALVTEQYIYYELETVIDTEPSDFSWMEDSAEDYLKQQLLAGEIRSSNTTVKLQNDLCSLYGTYRCQEMIGRVRREETILGNGKRD